MSKQGEFLKTLRRKKGLTQKQLAEKLNVSDKVISKWEVGDSFPDYSLLPNLAQILQVDVQEILNGEYAKKKNKEESINNVNNFVFVSNVNENNNVSNKNIAEEIKDLEEQRNNVVCSQCGSSDVEIIDDEFASCKHCGGVIQLKKISINETTNNINNYYNSNHFPSNLYYVDGKLPKAEFERNVPISISLNKDTPIDVLENCIFDTPRKIYSQFLVANIKFEGFVTATVGYDRQEEYIDYERKNMGNGHYADVQVIKKRKVTDWKPFSTNISSIEECCVGLGQTNDDDSDCFLSEIKALKGGMDVYPFEQLENKADITIEPANESDLRDAIAYGKRRLERSVKFPGDHVKDTNFNVSHQILNQERYIIPTWAMDYEHENEAYQVRSFFSSYKAMGTVPDVSKEIKHEIDEKAKPYYVVSMLSSIITIVFALLLCFVLKDTSLIVGNIILLVISIICFIVYKVKRQKFYRNTYNEKLQLKKEKLKEYLKEHGYKELTPAEEAKFDKGVR